MKDWLFNLKEDRIFYKIVAHILAIFLWFYVLNGQEIEGEKRISINYDLPQGMTFSKNVPKEVILTYRGPRLYLNRNKVKKDEIKINVSARQKKINIYQSMIPQLYGLELVGYSPLEVSVELDKIISKSIKVLAPNGIFLDKPRFIRVSGPKRVLKEFGQITLKLNQVSNLRLPQLPQGIHYLENPNPNNWAIKEVTAPSKID